MPRKDKPSRQAQAIIRKVNNALTTVFDPATPAIDVYNMGMIYDIRVNDDVFVDIDLAYSSPGHAGNLLLPKQIADTVRELDGVSGCKVHIVNDPPWSMDRVSDHARINMSVVGEAN